MELHLHEEKKSSKYVQEVFSPWANILSERINVLEKLGLGVDKEFKKLNKIKQKYNIK